MRFDFHLHTRFSDGTLSAPELMGRLHEAGVEVASITDHDTMQSYRDQNFVVGNGLKIIPGVEINTSEAQENLHILGFGRSLLTSETFAGTLSHFRQARRRRARAIVEKLALLGFEITMEDVEKQAKDSIGRPNIADALRDKGIVKNRAEAFQRFLLRGKPAYAPPQGPDPESAITAIAGAGGIAVLAHPGIASIDDKKLSSLVAMGLAGIEVYHPMHSERQTKDYLASARKFGLLATCGSDYHGPSSGREELTVYDFESSLFKKFLEQAGD